MTPSSLGYTDDTARNCAFYDWQRFNKKHFADWHAWLRGICKKNLPDVPIHAKPMIFLSMNREQMTYGVDGELFTAFSDIAGCDAYAFPDGDYQSYDWRGEEFWYDLLNSFRNQPVFNSENHVIPDGLPPVHVPATMTRAQFWQGDFITRASPPPGSGKKPLIPRSTAASFFDPPMPTAPAARS